MGWLHGAAVCSLYMAVGPALVLLNKHILSAVGFRYPILLSSLGLCFAATTAHVLVALGVVVVDKRVQQQVTWRFWCCRVLPVGACHAATLVYLELRNTRN